MRFSYALPADCHVGRADGRAGGAAIGTRERRGSEVLCGVAEARAHRGGGDRIHAVVRAAVGGTGARAVDRRCRQDSRLGGAQAEDGRAGCAAYSGAAFAEALSANLDSVAGESRCAAVGGASREAGAVADAGDESTARDGHGPGTAAEEKTVEHGGTAGVGSSAVGA